MSILHHRDCKIWFLSGSSLILHKDLGYCGLFDIDVIVCTEKRHLIGVFTRSLFSLLPWLLQFLGLQLYSPRLITVLQSPISLQFFQFIDYTFFHFLWSNMDLASNQICSFRRAAFCFFSLPYLISLYDLMNRNHGPHAFIQQHFEKGSDGAR